MESTSPGERSRALTFVLLGVVLVVGGIFVFSGSNLVINDWYALFKTVHVVFAVIWIGGGMLLAVNGIRAQRANDPEEIVYVVRQASFAGERIFAPAGLIVFLMGVAMMLNTNWGWGHFWVTVGLIGYVVTFLTGILVLSPTARRIEASVAQNGAGHATTLALVDRILLIARVDLAVLLLVIVDMVAKPFG